MLRVATHEIFCKCCFTDEGLSQDDSDDVVVAVIRRERFYFGIFLSERLAKVGLVEYMASQMRWRCHQLFKLLLR